MTAACICGAELPHRLQRYCGPGCHDRRVEQVIADVMRKSPLVRLPPAPKRRRQDRGKPLHCLWCGDDLAAGRRGRYCGPDCRTAYVADIRAEIRA